MKALMFTAALAGTLIASVASAQPAQFEMAKCDANQTDLGTIRLPQSVLADGKALAAGSYQVRLTSDHPTPAIGQSKDAACWVEFLTGTAVVGREVATVISKEEMAAVAKGPGPRPDAARVDVLKGGQYIRAWINHANVNYIINLPIASPPRP